MFSVVYYCLLLFSVVFCCSLMFSVVYYCLLLFSVPAPWTTGFGAATTYMRGGGVAPSHVVVGRTICRGDGASRGGTLVLKKKCGWTTNLLAFKKMIADAKKKIYLLCSESLRLHPVEAAAHLRRRKMNHGILTFLKYVKLQY